MVKKKKKSTSNAGDAGLIVDWEVPWRREWLSTPVFLPGEFHGQREEPGRLQSMESQSLTRLND